MARFDRGVTSFTLCNLDIDVFFPEDEVKCKWCPFIVHYDGLDRDKCSITNQILYTRESTGPRCPLTIMSKNVEGDDLP